LYRLRFLRRVYYPLSLLDATTPHPLIMKKTEIIHSTFVQHQNKNAFVITTLNLNSLLQLPEEKLFIAMFYVKLEKINIKIKAMSIIYRSQRFSCL